MDNSTAIEESEEAITIQPLFSKWHDHLYLVNSFLSQPKLLNYHSKHRNSLSNINQRANNDLQETSSLPPLFADNVWPGSLVLSDYLCNNSNVIESKLCLELGAAFGLPSMVACSLGAKYVVVTDYPAPYLLDNIESLFQENDIYPSKYKVTDFIWGNDITPLLNLISNNTYRNDAANDLLSSNMNHNDVRSNALRKYDVIFLAELLWKDTYTQHQNLVNSIKALLSYPDGMALLSFAHRPSHDSLHQADHDLEFIDRLCDDQDGQTNRSGHNLTYNRDHNDINSYNGSSHSHTGCDSSPDNVNSSSSDSKLKATLLETSTKYCDVSEECKIEVYLFKISFK